MTTVVIQKINNALFALICVTLALLDMAQMAQDTLLGNGIDTPLMPAWFWVAPFQLLGTLLLCVVSLLPSFRENSPVGFMSFVNVEARCPKPCVIFILVAHYSPVALPRETRPQWEMTEVRDAVVP